MKSWLSVVLAFGGMLYDPSVSFSQNHRWLCLNDSCDVQVAETPCFDQCGEPKLRFKFGVPLWLPEQHGVVTVRGKSAPVNVTTRDDFKLIDDIDNLFAGRLDVNYGRWGFFADGLYYRVLISKNLLDRIDLSSGFSQAIVDFAMTYDVSGLVTRSRWTRDWRALFLVGGRYNLLDANSITITGPRGGSITRSGSRDWVDPIFGGQIRAPLAEDLALSFRGDVGGFGIGSASYFTWNIEALAEFRCNDCLEFKLGYRLLDIDQRQGSGNDRFVYDVQLKGPIARIVLNF